MSNPIEGNDGTLYGTTEFGGAGNGTVFKINKDGSGYLVIKYFRGGTDGAQPQSALSRASDGVLYGTTFLGGASNLGTVFRVKQDGSDFAVIKSFAGSGEGANPQAPIIQANNGLLYGTTSASRANGASVVFQLSPDGSSYSVMARLRYLDISSSNPQRAGLVQASNGLLYGASYYDGAIRGAGMLFALSPGAGGTDFQVIKSFLANEDGANPNATPLEGSDGFLYGTTQRGGNKGLGTVFRIKLDGSDYQVIKHFEGTLAEGGTPGAALIQGTNGMLYGTTMAFGGSHQGTVFRIDPTGQDFSVLKIFSGTGGDGAIPAFGAAVAQGSDGGLYGMTLYGGNGMPQGSFLGEGTMFRINQDGSGYGVINTFVHTGGDGVLPTSQLVPGENGLFYGTTQSGGSADLGTVFGINPDGSGYHTLRSFTGTAGDGANPSAGLVLGRTGAFFGTTAAGGAKGAGTIFRIRHDGTGYAVVKSFSGIDGANPATSLVQGTNGDLFGTTRFGGNTDGGVLFRLSEEGGSYKILKSFNSGSGEGTGPLGSLVLASDGMLYGTTYGGGESNLGTIFTINQEGYDYRVIKSFTGVNGDGTNPRAALVQGGDGVLYGTTPRGGDYNLGIVFRINTDGSGFSTIKSFGGSDGANPLAALVETGGQHLYGTTQNGGSSSNGTVFRLNRDGTGYAVLKNFNALSDEGARPRAALTAGRDGALYGTTAAGGVMNFGTIFALVPLPPPNAVARVSPRFLLFAEDTDQLIIATSKAGSIVLFDGSQTTSTSSDALEFFWFVDGETNPFASGVRTARFLGPGPHSVTLIVAAGQTEGHFDLNFKVITQAQAVEQLIRLVQAAQIGRGESESLAAILEAARKSFDADNRGAAVHQLVAFSKRIQIGLVNRSPVLAEQLSFVAKQIILSAGSF